MQALCSSSLTVDASKSLELRKKWRDSWRPRASEYCTCDLCSLEKLRTMENTLSPGEIPAYVTWSNCASDTYHQRHSLPKYFERPRSSQERYQSGGAASYEQRGNLCVVNGLLIDDVHRYNDQTEPISQSPSLFFPTRTISTDGRKQSDFFHQHLPQTHHPGHIAWASVPDGQPTLCRTADNGWVLKYNEIRQPSNKEAWQGGYIELEYDNGVEALSKADGSTHSLADNRANSLQSTPVNTYSQATILHATPQASNGSVRVTSAGTAYDHERLPKIVAVHSLTQDQQALFQDAGNKIQVVHSSISSAHVEVYSQILPPHTPNEAFQSSTEDLQVYKEVSQKSKETSQVSEEAPPVSEENTQVSKDTVKKSTEISQVSKKVPPVVQEIPRVSQKASQASKETNQVSREPLQTSTKNPLVSKEASQVSKETPLMQAKDPRVSMETLQKLTEASRVPKEASPAVKETPHVSKKFLQTSTNNPRVSKEALRVSKETARVPKKIPQASRENLQVSKQTLQKSTEASRMSTEVPPVVKETPRVPKKCSQMSKETPRVSKETLQTSMENPQMSKKAPRVSKETPRVPKKSPQVSRENLQESKEILQKSTKASRESKEVPLVVNKTPRVSQSFKAPGRSESRRKSVNSSVPTDLSTDIGSNVIVEKADKTGVPSCLIVDYFSLAAKDGAEQKVVVVNDSTQQNLVELAPSRDTAKYFSADPSNMAKSDTLKKTLPTSTNGGALHKGKRTVTKPIKPAGVTSVDNGLPKTSTAELGRNSPKQSARDKEKPRRKSVLESTAERNPKVCSVETAGGKMATLSPARSPRWNPLSKQRLLKAFIKRAEQLEVIFGREPSVDKKRRLVNVMEVLRQRIKTLQEDLKDIELISFSDGMVVVESNSCSHKTVRKKFKGGLQISEREESGRLIATSCKQVDKNLNTSSISVDRQIDCREKAVGETSNPVDASGNKSREKETVSRKNRKRFTKNKNFVDALSFNDCKGKSPVVTSTKQVKQCGKSTGTEDKTILNTTVRQTENCEKLVRDGVKKHRKAIDKDEKVQKESENLKVDPNIGKRPSKSKKRSNSRKLEENKPSAFSDVNVIGVGGVGKPQCTGHKIKKLVSDDSGHDTEVIASHTSQHTVNDPHSNYKANSDSSSRNLFDNLLRRLNAMGSSTASALRYDLSCDTTQQLASGISGQNTDGRNDCTLINSQCSADSIQKFPLSEVINTKSIELHCSRNDEARLLSTVRTAQNAKERNAGINACAKDTNVKNENCSGSGGIDYKTKEEVSSTEILRTHIAQLDESVNQKVRSSDAAQTHDTQLVLPGAYNTSVKQLNSHRIVKEKKMTVPCKSTTKASPFRFEHLAKKLKEYHANPLNMSSIDEDAKEVVTCRRRSADKTPVESLSVGGATTNRKRKVEIQNDKCGSSCKKSRKSAPKKLLKFIKAEDTDESGTGLMMIPLERLVPNPCGKSPTNTELCVCKMEIEIEAKNGTAQPSINEKEARQSGIGKSVVGPTKGLCGHSTSSIARDTRTLLCVSNGASSSTHGENLTSHTVNHRTSTTPKKGHTTFQELRNSNVQNSTSHEEVKRSVPRGHGCLSRDTNLPYTRMRDSGLCDSNSKGKNQEQQSSECFSPEDFSVMKAPVSALSLTPSPLLYSPDLLPQCSDDLDRSLQLRDVKINDLHRKRERLLEDLHKISNSAARNV